MDWDEELIKFEEFSDICKMDDADAIVYLLQIAKRCDKISELAKSEVYRAMKTLDATEIHTPNGGACIKTRSSSKVDVNVLATIHPEIYEQLCESRKVTVPMKVVKELKLDDCLTTSESEWAELCK